MHYKDESVNDIYGNNPCSENQANHTNLGGAMLSYLTLNKTLNTLIASL